MNGRGIDEVGRVGYEYFSSLLYFIRIKQIIILTHARKTELHVNGSQQRGYDGIEIENGRFISQPVHACTVRVRVLNIFRYAAPKWGKGRERRGEIAKSRPNIPAAKWGFRARTFGGFSSK